MRNAKQLYSSDGINEIIFCSEVIGVSSYISFIGVACTFRTWTPCIPRLRNTEVAFARSERSSANRSTRCHYVTQLMTVTDLGGGGAVVGDGDGGGVRLRGRRGDQRGGRRVDHGHGHQEQEQQR